MLPTLALPAPDPRRRRGGAARALLAAAAVLSADTAAEARRVGEQPYSVAMHMHGSLSEGVGSMEWHADQARLAGVDVIWWTDHDWRIAHWQHLREYNFELATLDAPNQRVSEPDDAYVGETRDWVGAGLAVVDSLAIEGSRCLRMRQIDPFPLPFFFYSSVRQEGSRYHHRYSFATHPGIRFALFPEKLDPVDAKIVFQVRASDHVGGAHVIRYVLGSLSGEGAGAIALPYTLGQWNTYDLDVIGDAMSLFSAGGADSLRVEDNNLYLVSFELGARNGQEVIAFVDDYHIDVTVPSGDDMLDHARTTGAYYETTIPGVAHLFGSEISRYRSQPHMNGYAPGHTLVDYTGTTTADSIYYAVDQVHAQGGVVSLNHVFGVGIYGNPETPEQHDERIENTLRDLIQAKAYDADVFETGYRIRHGATLDEFLATWDALNGNAIFLTGNGITDSHGANFSNGWGPWQPGNPDFENNFVTWLWAPALSESAFVDALAGGRAWFGDPWAWDPDGTMDLATAEGFPMGRIVLTDRPTHDVIVEVTHCPGTPEIRLLQGEIRESPPVEYLDVSYLRDEILAGSLAGGTFTDTVTVDTTVPSFVRIEVGVPGQTFAYSNPVHFVPAVPQAGIADRRVAAALGDVLVRSARGLRLAALDFTASPPQLTIAGDEAVAGTATVVVDCGALGAPSSVTGAGDWSFQAGVLTLLGFTGAGSQAIVQWGGPVAADGGPAPLRRLELLPGTPNPFGSGSVIAFGLPDASSAFLEVFDVRGRRVRILLDKTLPAGRHRVTWDGRDHDGRPVGDGVYFVRLSVAGEVLTRKAVKVR